MDLEKLVKLAEKEAERLIKEEKHERKTKTGETDKRSRW